MYFRSQRKLQGELSLSDSLDNDGEDGSLSLIDVVRVDDNMLEELDLRDACAKVRRCVDACLTGREAHIIRLRYGLDDRPPLTQGISPCRSLFCAQQTMLRPQTVTLPLPAPAACISPQRRRQSR